MELETEILKIVIAWENDQSGPRMSKGELIVVARTATRPEVVELGVLEPELDGYRYCTATKMIEKKQPDGSYACIGKCWLNARTLSGETVYFEVESRITPVVERSLRNQHRDLSDSYINAFIKAFERKE